MRSDQEIHHRRSIRLQEYDYRQSGAYFVTIVTFRRKCLFGEIFDNEIQLSQFGKIARAEWLKTAYLRQNVNLWENEFVVMPNHIHGIVWITEENNVGAERRSAPTPHVAAGSLSAIIRADKSAVTYQINQAGQTPGNPVWQRNYYEHVIRNQKDLEQIYKYIQINPSRWSEDEENPEWQNRL